MMKRKLIEITCKSVKVKKIGENTGREDVNLMGFELYYPREGVNKIISLKQVKLKDNTEKKFTSAKYKDKVIFKEIVRGNFQLRVFATSQDNPSQFDKLIFSAFRGALKVALGGLTGGIGSAILGAAASGGQDFFVDSFKPEEGGVSSIGEHDLVMSSNSILEDDIVIPLTVPKDVVKRTNRHRDSVYSAINSNVPLYLAKGANNGSVILTVKVLKEFDD